MEDVTFHPCMKSGFCCTKSPCEYGGWNEERTTCKHLLPPNEVNQRECGRYDWIKENVPNWEFYPSFGTGCCMPLGNDTRVNIIKDIVLRKRAGEDVSRFIDYLKK